MAKIWYPFKFNYEKLDMVLYAIELALNSTETSVREVKKFDALHKELIELRDKR